ncbi:MAG TPA: hypothetical protein PLO75_00670, partial [Thermotogota bacterium]|nr:hypothetical protein [Thermotogota bacterium]
RISLGNGSIASTLCGNGLIKCIAPVDIEVEPILANQEGHTSEREKCPFHFSVGSMATTS